MSTPENYDTDVLLIGSGPAGGTAALLLATYGVRTHLVTKSAGVDEYGRGWCSHGQRPCTRRRDGSHAS